MSPDETMQPNSSPLRELKESNKVLLNEIAELNSINKKLLWEAQVTRRTLDSIRIALARPTLTEVHSFVDRAQLTFLDTLTVIHEKGLSFSRFGDGEMRLMLRADYKLTFQKNSPQLAADLRRILTQPTDSLLVGFPHLYRDNHWSAVWCDIWDQMKPLMRDVSQVGNSHVSRPIFFQNTGEDGLAAWRAIWNRKKISIITGKNSRFELIPELFDNTVDPGFIYSTPKNAYEDLVNVFNSALNDKSDLFLISLGPAGSVLAHWLAAHGRQAIDIGHISDSFLNVFRGGSWPENRSAVVER